MADRRIKKEIGLKRMVEWKKLGDVCSLKARIGWQGLTQKEHKKTGDYLLVTGTDFKSNYQVDFDHCVYVDEIRYTQDPNIQLRPNDVLITKDGTLGKMAVIEDLPKPATLNGGLFVIRDTTGRIHHKFLLHYMLSSKFQSIIESNHTNGTIKHLTQALLTNFPFPIPSLKEQERIVGILDTFTASIENLKEQIIQRRKQYEHYRDQLLDLEGKEGVRMKIEEFCLLKAGKSIKSDDIANLPADNYYPCYGGNGIRGFVPFYSHEGEYAIIGRQGALCGCVNWANGKFYATEHAVVATGNDKVTQRFLMHLFQHADLNQYKTQGAQPGLSVAKLNEVSFVIPSLSEQSRIVSILDTFESSISNLEAQLKEREKQYEYYRNKLLTFK